MKRDMDLVREILLKVEASNEPFGCRMPSFEQWPAPLVGYHVKLLIEAGLIIGDDDMTHHSPGYNFWKLQLSWFGHEFLDAARNDSVWRKARSTLTTAASGFTFDLLLGVLKALIVDQLKGNGIDLP